MIAMRWTVPAMPALAVTTTARLPTAIATRMQEAVARGAAWPEAQARLLASTPEAFSRFVRAEFARFGQIIRDADIKGE